MDERPGRGRAVCRPILAFVAILALFGAACVRSGGVRVEVTNASGGPMHNVTVLVTGNRYALGSLAAGSTQSVAVEPTGESHVEVTYDAAGAPKHAVVDCFFEPGYSGAVRVELGADGLLATRNDIQPGPW